MTIYDLKEKIIVFMEDNSYSPLNAEELIGKMKIKGTDLTSFWTALEELENNGNIIKTRYKTYGLPTRMGLVVGRLQLTAKGFGFVIPDNKGDKPDVFIPPSALSGAMNNDRVMARLSGFRDADRPEGEIIRIIIHANTKVVGTFVPDKEFGFVVPDDKRIGRDIYIAKNNFHGARAHQKVVAEIIVWPENRRSAEGKVVEILGNVGDVGLEILSIIKQNDLPLEFPSEVMQAANKVPEKIKSSELKERLDRRDYTIITVDGEDAKDLDDAVYAEKRGRDFFLGVYIADVSYYVKAKSVIDKEAFDRGTSVYLVDRVLPMLPVALSNGICSLNEGVDRLTMSCEMVIDGSTGLVKEYKIRPAVICTDHRMTYTSVRKILVDADVEEETKYADVVPMLHTMEELCHILSAKRHKRGAIDFDLPEQKVILDEEKKPIEIRQRERSIAEQIIEEFMLAANETVAEHMSKQKWPFIYRVHALPDKTKMNDLARLLRTFSINMKVEDEMQPIDIQEALAQIAGKPEERLVSTVALRSLKQAVYQTENLGHFGLAAKYYTHFTSPIRRYPDLIVHRLLRKWLANPTLSDKQKGSLEQELETIALNSSVRERGAAEAERATVDLKKVEYMAGFVGEEFKGTISGVTSFGMFVELENGVEGLVHISSLTDDYYEYVEDKYSLVGEHLRKVYRLGDEVTIEVLQVNIPDRIVDFIMAGENPATKEYLKAQISARNQVQGDKKGNKAKTGKTGKTGGAYFSTLKIKTKGKTKLKAKKKGGHRDSRQKHKNRRRKS